MDDGLKKNNNNNDNNNGESNSLFSLLLLVVLSSFNLTYTLILSNWVGTLEINFHVMVAHFS
jgi:hypothetical protein